MRYAKSLMIRLIQWSQGMLKVYVNLKLTFIQFRGRVDIVSNLTNDEYEIFYSLLFGFMSACLASKCLEFILILLLLTLVN